MSKISFSNQKTIGIGVIGGGGRIRSVLDSIPGVGKQFRVEALCDPSSKSRRALREKFNPTARIYGDYRQLVSAPQVDWVFIGSWNCFHRAHAVAALRAGKNVFCEKPLATTFINGSIQFLSQGLRI